MIDYYGNDTLSFVDCHIFILHCHFDYAVIDFLIVILKV